MKTTKIEQNLLHSIKIMKLLNEIPMIHSQHKILGHFLGVSQAMDYPDLAFPVDGKILGKKLSMKLTTDIPSKYIIYYDNCQFTIKNNKLRVNISQYLSPETQYQSSQKILTVMQNSLLLIENFMQVQNTPTNENIEKFLHFHNSSLLNLIMVTNVINDIDSKAKVIGIYGIEKVENINVKEVESILDKNRRANEKDKNSFELGKNYTYSNMADYLHVFKEGFEEVKKIMLYQQLENNLIEKQKIKNKNKI